MCLKPIPFHILNNLFVASGTFTSYLCIESFDFGEFH